MLKNIIMSIYSIFCRHKYVMCRVIDKNRNETLYYECTKCGKRIPIQEYKK